MSSTAVVPSPIGDILVVAGEQGILSIDVVDETPPDRRSDPGTPLLREAADQLGAYFAGERTAFDLPLVLRGTPFQVAVWQALQEIPYGETASYGEIARRLGQPTACRAVGAANGRNRIPIVIPCHRVIGASGTLTGYGLGLPRKQYLLGLEAKVALEHALAP